MITPVNLPLLSAAVALQVILMFAVPGITRRLCQQWGLIKPNFRGDLIPSSVGLTCLLVAAPVYAVLLLSPLLRRDTALYLLVIVSFGILGLADDRWGSRAVGGFRGHLRSLFALRPTTGALKLVGGGTVALIASALLHAPQTRDFAVLLPFLTDALVIALAANALNLLDLRPGRAQFGFAVLLLFPLLACLTRETRTSLPLLLVLGFAAAREGRADSRALAMRGDTGSNLLGAAAGLSAALFLPFWGRLILLLLLLALNLAAERVSLSRVIARIPWLDSLDRRLGIR